MVKSLEGFTESLLLKLVEFLPDARSDEKRAQRREEREARVGRLHPHPRFEQWEYHRLLTNGVRAMADSKPYETARVLIDALASMIRLRVYAEGNVDDEARDFSEIWCRRVNGPSQTFRSSEEDLVHTLTYACERVYTHSADSVVNLNEALRNQPWTLFKRIREHLYTENPNDQTKPWIRELISNYKDYADSDYGFEFQQMVRIACEQFGSSLLLQEERIPIFDSILSGPSESDYRMWLGEQYTDKLFNQRRRYFHLKQLRPFANLLFGKYAEYFADLDAEHKETLSDEDYSPISESRSGVVSDRSPKTKDELALVSDDELLGFINTWQEERRSADDWLVEISISALAGEFGSIFESTIVDNKERLEFWMKHLPNIERPIYVRAIIEAGQTRVKNQRFEKLDVWLDISAWILSHDDTAPVDSKKASDESRESPDWHSSRRAVGDFVESCVKEEVNAPTSRRKAIADLLERLCNEFDSRLDTDRPVLLSRDDQLTEAINNTRSRALESLLEFGYWVRRNRGSNEDSVPEVASILDKRLTNQRLPLTLPEYAILGAQFGRIWDLDKNWAAAHSRTLFPQSEMRKWREAFGNFLRYSRPFRPVFDALSDDFRFALEHLEELESTGSQQLQVTDTLGEHLFTYYLWNVYPLVGESSLLEQFYAKTERDKNRWANLFDHVGRSLKNTGPNLEPRLKERIIAFFERRLAQAEPTELKEITFWLESPSLEPEWRLKAYSKVLDVTKPDFALEIHIEFLLEMLEGYTSEVLECFAKITAKFTLEEPLYIDREAATAILQAGFDSADTTTQENAARAKEQLLRAGRFDLLDVGA